jgi:hypothetical protein
LKNNRLKYKKERKSWLGVDAIITSTPKDSLKVSLSSILRFKAKRFNEAINRLLQDT